MVNRFITQTGRPLPPEPKFGRLKAVLFVIGLIGLYIVVGLIEKAP